MSSKVKIALTTLGCRANQFDTAVLETRFKKADFEIVDFDSKADVYIVNSCSITANADAEAKDLVLKSKKNNPDAVTVMTGCSAQVHGESLKKIPGLDHVVGNMAKDKIVEMVAGLQRTSPNPLPTGERAVFFDVPDVSENRTRAFLKIQDGCSQFCSFCIVPFARGLNRSVPIQEILDACDLLAQKGFQEIVLTGIHLGTYGKDLAPKTSLFELMKLLELKKPVLRIRLSSIDPEELTDEMIDLIASSDMFCRHFHLPLQSGDDQILKKMRRRYTAEHFAELTQKIQNKMPDACIGTDVIVGFPGESKDAYENTKALILNTPVAYVHTFSYSDREGTKAAGFAEKTPAKVIRARSKEMRELSLCKHETYCSNFLGRQMEVIVLGDKRGEQQGLTRNYLNVFIHGNHEKKWVRGNTAFVKIDHVAQGRVYGSFVVS